jgi:malto-oligosyltrehalose trehalohydrolase
MSAASAKSTRSYRRPKMSHGPQVEELGVRFRLWAPAHDRINLMIEGDPQPLVMESLGEGWHELATNRAGIGSRYRFGLPDGSRVPDPASRFQPDDVHGPSQVMDSQAYFWRDSSWTGRPWREAVLYELHVGTFTEAGIFRAATGKLDHLLALGVTAIEIMPLADFPGRWNWGYDGVFLYAPDSTYGEPDDFKAFVDAAHARGIMVLLDVVYNHFGPEGNYLPSYAPDFFTERHQTAWGEGINFDGPSCLPVREFVIENALYWIEQFHLDGLRLDAIHAIVDDSSLHVIKELAQRVRAMPNNRPVHLILENEENRVDLLGRDAQMQPQWYTAQWNDDLHHVLHTAVSGERNGYYVDYHGNTHKLGRALAEGFAFQGERMIYRPKERGQPSAHLAPEAFVAFLQNHDQIGNRAFGDRISSIAPTEALRAACCVYLLLPQVPMLFMGEEWNASQPFAFFSDFSGELAESVRKGRREEFADFPEFQDPETRDKIPDPQSEDTFTAAKLIWSNIDHQEHAESLDWYKRILALRRETLVPRFADLGGNASRYELIGDGAVVVRWRCSNGSEELTLAANLSSAPVKGFPQATGLSLWNEGDHGADGVLGPWAVRWSVEVLNEEKNTP